MRHNNIHTDLRKVVGEKEKIYYEGKPDKKCYVFEAIFSPSLAFAIVWGALDFSIIGTMTSAESAITSVLLIFFAVHLMPVWIYLGGILLIRRKYRNTEYVITNHAIYVSGGVINKTIVTKTFMEIGNVHLHRGLFDQTLGVGDVVAQSIAIRDIPNYSEIYNLVKTLQKDIHTDVMYPNALRPDTNPGYRTEYRQESSLEKHRP